MIFSSHILSEVQTICDQIIMIAHGKLAAFDTPENLEKQLLTPGEITLTAQADPAQVEKILTAVPDVSGLEIRGEEDGRTSARLHGAGQDIYQSCREIFLAFAGAGVVLLELTPKKASLEEVFLELSEPVGEENPGKDAGREEAEA